MYDDKIPLNYEVSVKHLRLQILCFFSPYYSHFYFSLLLLFLNHRSLNTESNDTKSSSTLKTKTQWHHGKCAVSLCTTIPKKNNGTGTALRSPSEVSSSTSKKDGTIDGTAEAMHDDFHQVLQGGGPTPH